MENLIRRCQVSKANCGKPFRTSHNKNDGRR